MVRRPRRLGRRGRLKRPGMAGGFWLLRLKRMCLPAFAQVRRRIGMVQGLRRVEVFVRPGSISFRLPKMCFGTRRLGRKRSWYPLVPSYGGVGKSSLDPNRNLSELNQPTESLMSNLRSGETACDIEIEGR
ncbi:hypothetical protein MPH_05334 [Macrophomina phaseolina MS6]|uniref:Uncharacterized protein n=1 Tax=Macrophomina phaseolina (strain MS6) TaxID=1126212 RepID=K2RRR6_MACPH|nr:hypothetical protein MPH_05334 [Macrophomina phaseolina MS6]